MRVGNLLYITNNETYDEKDISIDCPADALFLWGM